MAKLDWQQIEDMYTLGGYEGRAELSDSSALLALCALNLITPEWVWEDYDDFDDVQTAVDLALAELMTGPSDMYKCALTRTGAQLFTSGNWSAIYWNAEIYDPEDMHSLVAQTARIYCKRAGLYLINASVAWVANAVGVRQMSLAKVPEDAGPTVVLGVAQRSAVSAGGQEALSIDVQLELVVDDYVYVTAYQNSGGDLNVMQDDYSPIFTIVRL